MLIEQPLRFSRNLRTFRMYPRLDIFNQWLHAAIRLFSTVISNRPQMTSICGKDKKVADEPQVSAVSLIFIPHFLIVFIRFKQWRERFKKKKRQLALYRLLSVLGLVQVFSKSHCTLRFVSTSPFLLYLTCEQFFPRAFQGLAQRRMNCPKNV